VITILLLLTALSLDAFATSFAYGSSRIKITFKAMMIINIIGSIVLGASLAFGAILSPLVSESFAHGISFSILFTLGLIKIFDSAVKNFIRKHSDANKKLEFNFFNLKFILNVYANPEKADLDGSRTISAKESLAIALALSLDSFAVGFGFALAGASILLVIVLSLLTDLIALVTGSYFGEKLAKKTTVNLSWLGGVILIFLAFL